MYAFSFCLYNPPNSCYYAGLLENIDLIHTHFPGWIIYVYLGNDVPAEFRASLDSLGCRLRDTGEIGHFNMVHRFFAIDEPDIELMMVRDADSRIHWKDRWAIREFASQTQFTAHTIRDNIEHTAVMMGGLWGLRKSSGLDIHAEYASYTEDITLGHRHAHDQNFLHDVVYPKVLSRILVHYSNGRRLPDETAVEFPFEWSNDVYCGRVEADTYRDFPQPPLPVFPKWLLPNVPTRVRYSSPVVPQLPIEIAMPPIKAPSTSAPLNFLHKK